MQEDNFSKFGKNFQEKLACLILSDRPFSEQIEEVLETDFFEFEHIRIFAKIVFDYRKKYKTHPSYSTLETLLKTELERYTEADRDMVEKFFIETISECGEMEDAEFIKDLALDFCKKRKVYAAMVKSIDHLEHQRFDNIKIELETALNLGNDNNYGHDYKLDFEERYMFKTRSPISTGWDVIDEITDGGLGAGELGVCIAATGGGKSIAMCHLSANAVRQGKTVVYYTLELSEAVVGLRHDSWLSGVSLNALKEYKEDVLERIKDVPGELIVKNYPTKTASIATLERHLEKMKMMGKKIDMIIIDYGDLLKPTKAHDQKRMELSDIYEEMRGIAGKFKCPVWSCSQTNRSGLNAEIITMEAISEAYAKCFCADFIFSISRTIEDKNSNTGRIFIAKNRNGIDASVFPIFMNPEFVKIRVLEPTGESVEHIVENAAKKQEERMKAKMVSIWKKSKS